MGNLKTFQYKGKTYKMVPIPGEASFRSTCLECPLQKSCADLNELDTIVNLKGGFCSTLNAYPVLVEERKILLKKSGPFRNSNEEDDWNEVLTIAKSWGWIQD